MMFKHVKQSYTIVRTLDVLGNPCDSHIFDEYEPLTEHIEDLKLWSMPFEVEELAPL